MKDNNVRNIFEDINKKIALRCSSVDEIYENIPYMDNQIEKYVDIRRAFIASIIPVVGLIGITDNIFKKINSNSKNISNLNIKDGELEKNLINKSMDELIKIVKFNEFSIQRYLNNLKVYRGLETKDIIKKSNYKKKYIESVFAHESAKYKRNPSRDCIIGLSFAFNLNLVETNYLLKAAGYNELYIRNKRDLIVAKSILEEFNIKNLNQSLLKYELDKVGNLDDEECYDL